jgi:hypothetical protein
MLSGRNSAMTIPATCRPANKQLERTLIGRDVRAASASFHYAHAALDTAARRRSTGGVSGQEHTLGNSRRCRSCRHCHLICSGTCRASSPLALNLVVSLHMQMRSKP